MTDLPDPERYGLVVFDLDGTLYHQTPVRRRMLAELVLAPTASDGPGRIERIRILGRFRRLREEMAVTAPKGFDTPLFARLASETGRDAAVLRRLVEDWMERRPLRHLRANRVAGAGALFKALRRHGTQIAVWSDYPVRDKLDALELRADHLRSAQDSDLGTLKPDPAGLAALLDHVGLPPGAVLMVGDRDSHDGAAARALGVEFLLRARRGPPGIPRVSDFRGLAARLG